MLRQITARVLCEVCDGRLAPRIRRSGDVGTAESGDTAGEDDLALDGGDLGVGAGVSGRDTEHCPVVFSVGDGVLVAGVQELQERQHGEVGPRHVDVERVREVGHVDLLEQLPPELRHRLARAVPGPGPPDARVGDQQVQVPGVLGDEVDGRLQRCLGCHVALHGDHDP